jgi:hypothetical protein
VPCPAGFYCPGASSDKLPCPAGKYAAGVNAAACDNCEAGKYSAAVGSTAVNTCSDCGAGKYQATAGSIICDECEAGKHKPVSGINIACDDCQAGKHKAAAGINTACDECQAGKYKATAGVNTACDNCEAGTYSLAGAGLFPVGVQINFSTSLLSGLSCTACYDKPYRGQSGGTLSSNIETCKSAGGNGSWIAMGSKSSSSATSFDVLAFIPASALVTSSSTSQAYGPINGVYWYYYSGSAVGFASSSSINIKINQADTLSTDCSRRLSWHLDATNGYGGFRSGCTLHLDSDEYYDTEGNIRDNLWRKVIYSCTGPVAVTALTHCFDCVAGKYSAAGESVCTDCGAGTYSLVGAALCTNCEAGRFSANTTSTTCVTCPAGTYSAAGASVCTDANSLGTCGSALYDFFSGLERRYLCCACACECAHHLCMCKWCRGSVFTVHATVCSCPKDSATQMLTRTSCGTPTCQTFLSTIDDYKFASVIAGLKVSIECILY